MRVLHKFLVIVFLMSLGIETYAQSLAVKGGLNLSSLLLKDNAGIYSEDYYNRIGFHVGGMVEYPLSENIVFETGLVIATKGFWAEENLAGTNYKQKFNLLYLDIPATAKIYFGSGDAKSFINIGAYLGYGLSGKNKGEITNRGITTSETIDIEWGSDEDDVLKPLDFGFMGGLGIEVNSTILSVFYQLGLANILSYEANGTQIKNRVLGVSLGYKLGGK